MKSYKIVLELDLHSTSPLLAAKMAQEWERDFSTDLQYYVQEDESGTIYSVDLSEDDDQAVQEIDNYIPLIK